MKKIVYMVQMNLSGLHRKVYKMKWNKELREYYDSSGDISTFGKNTYAKEGGMFGISQLIFKNKRDASNTLKGALLAVDFIVNLNRDYTHDETKVQVQNEEDRHRSSKQQTRQRQRSKHKNREG
jgi:hypothetical protein